MNRDSRNASGFETAPRLRDRLREETARAILSAAEEVFAEEGLHAARMERIAGRAGVAVGTLYNHFEDRSALIAALCGAGRAALLDRVDAAVAAAAAGGARAELRAFLEAVVAHARQRGRFLSVLVQAGEGPARAQPGGALLEQLVARVEAVVARGAAAGELRADLHGLLAPALVGMIRLLVMRAIEGEAGWEEIAGAALELFLEGAAR
jgi:AcrR family transcriptional regulator